MTSKTDSLALCRLTGCIGLLLVVVPWFAPPAGAAETKSDGIAVQIQYFEVKRVVRPTLSNIMRPAPDRGLQGAILGLKDNNSTGRFLKHDYRLTTHIVPATADWKAAARKGLADTGSFVVINAPAQVIRFMAGNPSAKSKVLINAGSGDDELRRTLCAPNLFHTLPSRAMRADALLQFLVKRRWRRLFLVSGRRAGDVKFAASIKRAITKFRARLVAEKTWLADADLRRNAAREAPQFTQGPEYDALIVADESKDFGQYLLYNTWLPRPVAGSHGLQAVAWSSVVEQWGAAQLQRRFRKVAKRGMTGLDYAAWAAVRSIGEAVTRLESADATAVRDFLRSDKFALAGFKGRKLSFRAWNGQLRQPIPLVHETAVVAVAPIAGYLHRRTEMDTLGFDRRETDCGG
jgi:ABC transporter substrate binding protein (PQQ-dependent alcohol dehydrogenase system)